MGGPADQVAYILAFDGTSKVGHIVVEFGRVAVV